jgi:uncharacterized protein YceK
MPQVAKNFEGYTDGPTIQRVRGSRSVLRKRMFVLAVSVCALLSGCSNVATIWSTEVRSPDGLWLAKALTEQHSGPGNALLQTTVLLKHTKGPKEPIEVLLFTQDAKSIDLKMNWLTPSHLEVTYKQPAVIDFQAIKCGGVDISVQDVSSGAVSSSRAGGPE